MRIPVIGRTLGHYRILEKIGEGGMGVVFRAHDDRLDRDVAFKVLRACTPADEAATRRLRREALALARLNHHHIAAVYDFDTQGGVTFLVMEYVPGSTLADRVMGAGLPEPEVLRLGLQIAAALEEAHGFGVVHRDLKPGNIKVTPKGQVKVLDFGLATLLHSAVDVGPTHTATDTGGTPGTVAYMAPEQLRGQPADTRSDIFAAGVVLYEMATGRRPFYGRVTTELADAILHTPAPPPSRIRFALSERLEDVILKCLEKNPDNRYQSAKELVVDLRRLAASTTPSESLPSPVVRRRWRRLGVRVAIASGAVLAMVAITLTLNVGRWRARLLGGPTRMPIRSVAVLPFANLSGDPQNVYFSDGITEEILSHLVRIPGLKVVSVRRSQRLTSEASQVGKEVGVGAVLEGGVRREGNRVRITARLTNTEAGELLWASEPYDRELSDIFAVQSSVALQIANTLNATLNPKLRESVEQKPTESPDAYDAYLRGTDYYRRGDAERDVRAAIASFEQAVRMDPNFALAHAMLSVCHAQLWWYHFDRTPHRVLLAKRAIDRALELQPELPQVHLALGRYYYFAHLDYDRALKEFAIARAARPSDSETLFGTAAVLRRQGKMKEALTTYRQASELDPRNAVLLLNLGETYALARDLAEAVRSLDRALALTPDWAGAYALKVRYLLRLGGEIERARETAAAATTLALPEDHELAYSLVLFDLFSRSYQGGLDRLSAERHDAFESQFWSVPKALLQAQFYGLLHQRQAERSHYEWAVKLLKARLDKAPDDPRFHGALGIAYAGLGRKDDAIREATLAVTLMPATKDAYRAAYRIEDLARTYAMLRERDSAVDQLEYLMSIPVDLAAAGLRVDPTWDSLRGHPRFQRLTASESRPPPDL